MVLNTEPTGDVVFDLTSENTEEATLSSSSLTFSTGNWNTAQTVTITGVDDDEDDEIKQSQLQQLSMLPVLQIAITTAWLTKLLQQR